MLKTTFLFLLTVISISAQEFTTNFKTFDFSAKIQNGSAPASTVNSCMDSKGNVHIAWIQFTDGTEGGERNVMYTYFDRETEEFSTKTVDNQQGIYARGMPFIATDTDDKPHIVYFLKRNNETTRSGNYAIMYATSNGNNSSFSLSKVSANKVDPNNRDENIYNCWVNGRPRIFFENNIPVVTYISRANDLNSYTKHMIFAKKLGSTWQSVQAFETSNDFIGGTYSEQNGVSIDVNTSQYIGLYDISNYYPRYLFKNGNSWQMNRIDEYFGNYKVDSPKIVKDSNDKVHFFWYYDDYDNNEEKFCHTILNNNNYSTINTVLTTGSNSNHHLATVDINSGKQVYYYSQKKGYSSFKGKGTLVLEIDDEFKNFEVSTVGRIYGKNNLHANNGEVAVVTASEDRSKIYVTINKKTFLSANEYILNNKVNVYPTIVESEVMLNFSELEIKNISIIDILGQVTRISNFSSNVLHLNELNSGIYLLQIETTNGKFITKKIIKK